MQKRKLFRRTFPYKLKLGMLPILAAGALNTSCEFDVINWLEPSSYRARFSWCADYWYQDDACLGGSVSKNVLANKASDSDIKNIYIYPPYEIAWNPHMLSHARQSLSERLALSPKIRGVDTIRVAHNMINPSDSLWFVENGWTVKSVPPEPEDRYVYVFPANANDAAAKKEMDFKLQFMRECTENPSVENLIVAVTNVIWVPNVYYDSCIYMYQDAAAFAHMRDELQKIFDLSPRVQGRETHFYVKPNVLTPQDSLWFAEHGMIPKVRNVFNRSLFVELNGTGIGWAPDVFKNMDVFRSFAASNCLDSIDVVLRADERIEFCCDEMVYSKIREFLEPRFGASPKVRGYGEVPMHDLSCMSPQDSVWFAQHGWAVKQTKAKER